MIKFDYKSILERLQTRLKTRLGENSELLFFSTNQRILEAIAEELQESMRYDEYLTRETKWNESQNLSSVLSQIGFFNYTPHRMIGSVGEVTVSTSPSFSSTYPNRVILPKYTEFSSQNLTFCSTRDMELPNNLPNIKIPVVQGAYKEYVYEITYAYSPQELVDFAVTIENPKIENFVYDLTVNGVLWRRVDHFGYSAGVEDTVYELRNKNDFSGIILQFGDGVQSRRLAYGDLIRFRCIETEGDKGEVLRTNAVDTVVSTVRDSSNNRVTLYCKNEGVITSGDSYETIQSIKYNAPRALRLSSRLLSKTDYQAFLTSSGLADKAMVWGETEENIDNNRPVGTFIPYTENIILISGINVDANGNAIPLSFSEQTNIREQISGIKSLTDIIQFRDPKITYLKFIPTVGYSADKFSGEQVIISVTKALMEEYSLLNPKRMFREALYYSQFYEVINALPEVVWHQTDMIMVQYIEWLRDPLDGSVIPYTFEIELLHNYIFEGTVELYLKNIDTGLPEGHPYKDWFLVSTFNNSGKLEEEIIPEWDEDPAYEIPDADGSTTFLLNPSDPNAFFDYQRGRFQEDTPIVLPDLASIRIENGLFGPTQNYQLKIEFKGGSEEDSVRPNVIPTKRNQIFACEFVEPAILFPVYAEDEMGN